jgi:DNA-binding CsgD family transcriptional regulator
MRLAASGELRERLATALDGLVVEQRDVLRLRVVEGRPYSEVACELGISEQTARARTSRALRALRALRESAALRDLMERAKMHELEDLPMLAELGDQLKAGFRRREARRLPAGRLLAAVTAAAAITLVVPDWAESASALYRALALVPGVHLVGEVRTLTGRPGEAIGAGGEELIIDRRTGMMLGWQDVITDSGAANLPARTVAYQLAITARAIPDNLAPPRAPRGPSEIPTKDAAEAAILAVRPASRTPGRRRGTSCRSRRPRRRWGSRP